MERRRNFCPVCKCIADHHCGSCEAVYYCSHEHQISHWKIHGRSCRAYKIVENAQLGMHCVATRNLKIGKTVMHDRAPLLTAPQNLRGIGRASNNFAIGLKIPPTCLGCYIELKPNNAKVCKCGWHLCGKCTEHGTECKFTQTHATARLHISRTDYGQPHPAYEIVGVARALALRENAPASYKKLMNLRDPIELTANKSLIPQDAISAAARFTKQFFRVDGIEEAEICKIIRIILLNGYLVTSSGDPCRAVYDAPSYVEHNCKANCSKSFTDDGGIVIWAAVPISKGDPISISYVPPLWGTIVRQKNLLNVKYFECECERCADPTEFGTMFNAMKCVKEKCKGYMLPPTFAAFEENYPAYVCSTCSATMPWESLLGINEQICAHWKSMNKSNAEECQKFLDKWKNVLHENHFHMVDVELDFIFADCLCNPDMTARSKKCLKEFLKLCKRLIDLLRKIAPAENQFKGLLLYIVSRINKVLFDRSNINPTPERRFKFMEEHKKLLTEIYQLLHRERNLCPLEKEIASSVMAEIRKMESLPEVRLMMAACAL